MKKDLTELGQFYSSLCVCVCSFVPSVFSGRKKKKIVLNAMLKYSFPIGFEILHSF